MPQPITALELITDAFFEAGVYSPSETITAADASFALSKLTRLLDAWNADEFYIYTISFSQFAMVANVQPLTIGQAAVVTSASLTGNVATYVSKNFFKEGDSVDVVGCTTAALNVSGQIISRRDDNSFDIAIVNANIPTEAENAKAVFAGVAVPNFATLTQRPAKVVDANIILNNVSPVVRVPLRIRDDDWWAANSVPGIATTIPTDLYYSPDWPNGSIYLWPKQTSAFLLELEIWTNLADLQSLTTPFYLPQGYRDAITYSLAETLCPAFGRPLDAVLQAAGQRARAIVKDLNSVSPTIATRDAGIPSGSRGKTYFNWLSGSVVNR